jgi:hypothetical protein
MRSLAWGARFVIHVEGFFLNPGEVTPALLRGHGSTDLEEVFQHVFLALDAGVGSFQQEFLNLGGEPIRLLEQFTDPAFTARNALAEFGAPWQVSLVKRQNLREVLGRDLELGLQPCELRLFLLEQGPVPGGHRPVGGAGAKNGEDGTEQQDDQGTSHQSVLA